ncbi:hypothetical protein COR50_00825 [Chitinophaga caeni]|uniref:LTXXQ motif family protein n=1 Tax=Chitinophaga caeni TaxID=2029983 RepID=A0A291QPF5_9BACT|nr:hypothetical protein [Chitinophaga caeni]ATL45816.1 hypothetical protein COR50_00825 [Chitinophaga caeni]
MKQLFTFALALVTSLLIIQTQNAQAQKKNAGKKSRWTAEGKADKMGDKLVRELHLSKEQSKLINNINEDIFKKSDAVKKNSQLSKREQMQQLKALDEERSQRFKAVLTPEQYKKWNDWDLKKKESLESKMDKKQERRGKAERS